MRAHTATYGVAFLRPSMTAYYNEIDPFAAQWLRNLINAKAAQAFIECVIYAP